MANDRRLVARFVGRSVYGIVALLRRTFSSFEFGERRQLGEKAAQNGTETVSGSLKTPTQNHGAFNETLREKSGGNGANVVAGCLKV